MKHKYEDLTGKKFGRLTVCSWAFRKYGQTYWKCRCDCGNEITTQRSSLIRGDTISCGCYNADKQRKHSMSKTRVYNIWMLMKARCLRTTSPAYKDYGGRGIKIVKDWFCFESFYKWSLSNGYASNLTLDRIDVNGDYCPENCRWIPMSEQRKNKRDSLKINGVPLKDLCVKLGVSYKLAWKYKNNGMSLSESLMKAIDSKLKKITAHINRLKDEEQTEEVIAQIEALKAERAEVVAKIKSENPYSVE